MKNRNFIKYGIFSGMLILGVSCTNLDEKILDATETSKADADVILNTAYKGLRNFENQDGIFALAEVSTDVVVVPTRAGDWGDGGAWIQAHNHKWDANNREVNTCWKQLLSSVYSCDLTLALPNLAPNKKAQALFLKAFYYYNAIDLYGQVPYREAGSDPEAFPKVWTSPEATAQIIAMLTEALPDLAEKSAASASVANKDAANFLLAKIYLNKAVFDSPTHTNFVANNAANMTKVVEYVDAIKSTLAPDYWDNFKPSNGGASNEIIFSSKNINGVSMGNIRSRFFMGAHYNQTPGGWNGFSILTDFYNSFDNKDRRILNKDAEIIANFGNPMGMQIGQQYKPGGVVALKTRDQNGNLPLTYSSDNLPESLIITEKADLERFGIRPQKYIPDVTNYDKPENDYVFFRYADAMLMKAEAILRGGTGSLGTIAEDLSGRTGITTALDLSTLDGILKARGNELFLEGWRRNDMIRFGTYTTSRATMKNTDGYRVLMPLPTTALLNPNLKQNPSY